MKDLNCVCRAACDWVLSAGAEIRRKIDAPMVVREKGIRDLVTDVDGATERRISAQIRRAFPEDRIFAEESQSDNSGERFTELGGDVWFLDPIDGTHNFIKQRRDFAVMLALYRDGIGVFSIIYDVIRDECLIGIAGEGVYLNGRHLAVPAASDLAHSMVIIDGRLFRARDPLAFAVADQCLAIRAPGASSMSAMLLARGAIGAYLTDCQMPWDAAAPNVILRELGYRITRPDGKTPGMLEGAPYLIALPALHAEIIALSP